MKQHDPQLILDGAQHTLLGKIIGKARFLLTLDHYVKTLLPTSFQAYCHVMNVDKGVLILGVSNAAIATRIQFMSDDLTRKIKNSPEFRAISHIKCKVCAE